MSIRFAALLLLAAAVLALAGCDRERGQATRFAAECEDLRSKRDPGALAACRREVDKGCASFGAGDPFCGMAHMHLGLAIGGAGGAPDSPVLAAEFQQAELILCAAGGRWQVECAQAQTLSERLKPGAR